MGQRQKQKGRWRGNCIQMTAAAAAAVAVQRGAVGAPLSWPNAAAMEAVSVRARARRNEETRRKSAGDARERGRGTISQRRRAEPTSQRRLHARTGWREAEGGGGEGGRRGRRVAVREREGGQEREEAGKGTGRMAEHRSDPSGGGSAGPGRGPVWTCGLWPWNNYCSFCFVS